MTQMRLRSTAANPGAGRPAHYSDEWYTPPELVRTLGEFDLDPAAGPMLHATENWGGGIDGLAREWHGRVWLNPPYSNVHDWLERFAQHGNGVALVNARPETQWFQRIASRAGAACWVRRRVEFLRPDGATMRTPVGSVLLAFGAANVDALKQSALGITMLVASDV